MCNFILYFIVMISQFILPAKVKLRADSIHSEPGVPNIDTSVCQSCSICPVCNKKAAGFIADIAGHF
jgi:hypothetical protein